MANSALNAQIRARIDAFSTELAGLVRQAAFESLQTALGASGSTAATARRSPGRPKGSGRKRGRPAGAANAELAARVVAHVKANDGQSVSDIAKGLRANVESVKAVMPKLLADKQIKKTGQRRGTKYHAAGAGRVAANSAETATKRRKARRGRAK